MVAQLDRVLVIAVGDVLERQVQPVVPDDRRLGLVLVVHVQPGRLGVDTGALGIEVGVRRPDEDDACVCELGAVLG